MQSWNDGQPLAKAMLFTGPPGVGKTSLVPALAMQFRTPLVKHNMSRDRDAEKLKALTRSSQTQGLSGGRKLIFLDECDYMTKAGAKEVINMISKTKSPVILAANYYQKIPVFIRKQCLELEFPRPTKDDLKEYVMRLYHEDSDLRARGADMLNIISNARSYRQAKNMLLYDAPVSEIDCYVEDKGAMVEALFAGARLGIKPWQGQDLQMWIHDNARNPEVARQADMLFAQYRRVGYPLGDLALSLQSLSLGGEVRWPWSLKAANKKPVTKKQKAKETKIPTRGRGRYKVTKGVVPIDDFF